MRKIISWLFMFVLIIFTTFTSCKKSHNSNSAEPNIFMWTFLDTTYNATVNAAYLSSITSTGPIIKAGTGNSMAALGCGPIISLTSLNEGTYWFDFSNSIMYIDKFGNLLQGNGGLVQITKNSNGLISGNFSTQLYSGAYYTITGIFKSVPINQ